MHSFQVGERCLNISMPRQCRFELLISLVILQYVKVVKLLLLFFFQGKQGVSDVLEILKEEFKTAMILAGGKVVPF